VSVYSSVDILFGIFYSKKIRALAALAQELGVPGKLHRLLQPLGVILHPCPLTHHFRTENMGVYEEVSQETWRLIYDHQIVQTAEYMQRTNLHLWPLKRQGNDDSCNVVCNYCIVGKV